MANAQDPQNDREWIIKLDQKIDRLSDVIETIGNKWEMFEKKKLTIIDSRLNAVEKWQDKWGGALIALSVLAIIASIISTILRIVWK